jgi:copper homeostasis protein
VDEAVSSFDTGADRAELCHSLDVGGLTPNPKAVQETLAATSNPVFALVRPTAETFRLSPAEVDALIEEVETLVSLGVDGVVVGMLDREGHVDQKALADVVRAADGRPVTFHRAFDEVEDPLEEIESLIHAGVRRVLTSGGAATAWEGRETLRALVQACGDDLTVLGGGRVRGDHVRQLVEETGLTEVHARASAIPEIIEALNEPSL